jgi:hypothetical protein
MDMADPHTGIDRRKLHRFTGLNIDRLVHGKSSLAFSTAAPQM